MYSEQVKEIEKVITDYFEGIFYGDVSKLENSFQKDIIIYGDINGEAYVKNLEQYLDGVRTRKSPKELNEDFNMKIVGINISGTVAMAAVHVPMLGFNYYDYLSLVKINHKWKIVNKIFSHVT